MLEGETVPGLTSSGGTEHIGQTWVRQVHFTDGGENLLLYTPLDTISGEEGTSPEMFSQYRSVVAVPEANITSAWQDIFPGVGIAGGMAVLISVAIAFVFSRSISKPLGQITRASEEMARGNYNQRIEVRGRDEVARLATAFNAMALEVNRSQATLRQFLADASHELRTPLTSIQGFSQAMAEGTIENPDDLQDSARIINEEAQRMRSLVDDLLYLSQIEAGQVIMQPEPLELGHLLRDCVERFERRARGEGRADGVGVAGAAANRGRCAASGARVLEFAGQCDPAYAERGDDYHRGAGGERRHAGRRSQYGVVHTAGASAARLRTFLSGPRLEGRGRAHGPGSGDLRRRLCMRTTARSRRRARSGTGRSSS